MTPTQKKILEKQIDEYRHSLDELLLEISVLTDDCAWISGRIYELTKELEDEQGTN